MAVKLLFFDSYISAIKNSVDAKVFKTLWAEVEGERKDIIEGGQYACAIFVSSILSLFDLIEAKHATVGGTLKDLESFGWEETTEPKVGCVIHWEKRAVGGSTNEHVGFFIGDDKAISNDYETGSPQEHHWTYGEEDGKPTRKIIAMYWHPKLENKYF